VIKILTLSKENLENNKSYWLEQGLQVPSFDIEQVSAITKEEPTWLHFGAGNIFRAFPALSLQNLLNNGKYNKGIIACETFDEEIIEKAFTPYDNLTTAVILKYNGDVEISIVASIVESLVLSKNKNRLEQIFANPSLQIVSFTITEKGYATKDNHGKTLPWVLEDQKGEPTNAKTAVGLTTYLLLKRFNENGTPLALVSMDNCANNGDLLKGAIHTMATSWLNAGHVNRDFLEYLQKSVSYPISMIDKITPGPSNDVADILQKVGFKDTTITKTGKNTVVSPFVNAEETGYLVIEDIFPNGRPPLEQAGIIFSDRSAVENIEKMKVGACLNPLHTIIAIFGCLLGYTAVSQAMKDKALVKLIEEAGYREALPHVPDPGIINPQEFIKEVLTVRFPNPFIPDTPQRIATDTSLKIPVRFGEVLKTMEKKGQDLSELKAIPFFVAGWFRYLTKINDAGVPFELSPDPMLQELVPIFAQYKMGEKIGFDKKTKDLLKSKAIFGVDLEQAGLAKKIEQYFNEMISEAGAVRVALDNF